MAARLLRISLALGLLVLAALALPASTEAASFNEVKKLFASDAQAGDVFGNSVAVSGDNAIVGARGASIGGAAYVFQRSQGGADNWGEVRKLTASDAQAGDQFGWSVAISGDTAVIGARLEDVGGSAAGAAYVFWRNESGAGNWGEVRKLTASDAQAGDQFGWSVAISGDTAVVGAHHEDAGGDLAGAAYVFQRNEGGADNWGEVKKLTASDGQADDFFGYSVTVSGDTAVVGAHGEDAGGGIFDSFGAAYVYQRNEGGADNWGEVKKLIASDAQAHDQFGESVAVSGDTAVVGAFTENAGGSAAGAAYVFQRNKGGADNWGEMTKLIASDAHAGDRFGGSVAVSGDTAVVGAAYEYAGLGIRPGAAYEFQRDEGGADNWGEMKKLTASDAEADDVFGHSVTVGGDTVVVGAPGEDTAGFAAGAAYVYDLLGAKSTPTITPTATITATPTITPTVTIAPTVTITPTPCPTGKVPADGGCGTPMPVGGISLDSDLRPLSLETTGSASPPWAFVGFAGAACLFALGSGVWYARRRRACPR